MRDRVDQDELDYDTKKGQWAPSIFDGAEPVEELEPECHSLDGHLEKENNKLIWVKRK